MSSGTSSFNFDDDEDGRGEGQDKTKQYDSLQPTSVMPSQDPFDTLLKAYMRRLERNPLLVKAITCSVVSALGALVDQLASRSSSSKRTNRQPTSSSKILSFALYGGLVGGPMGHFWNQWLNENVNIKSTSWGLLVDQLIAQPPMLFLMHVVLDMAGAAVHELPFAWSRSIERTGRSVVSSWRFWPLAVYITMYLAKKKRHATFAMQLAGVFWMSKMARQRAETQPLTRSQR